MNKIYRINIIALVVIVVALVFSFSAFNTSDNSKQQITIADKNHTNKSAELVNSRKSVYNFRDVDLFLPSTQNHSYSGEIVSKAAFSRIDKTRLAEVNSTKPDNVNLILKNASGHDMVLELAKINLIPYGFKIKNSNGNLEDYKGGLYYQGILKGDNTSFAAVSIFEDNVIGIISTNDGNYNLGALVNEDKSFSDEYILYNDRDLIQKQSFTCGVGDSYDSKYYRNRVNHKEISNITASSTTSPVRMYYVCDYQLYLDKGSNTTNVVNYVTAVFNQVRILYQNESLPMELASSMFVYTSADPYRTFSTQQTPEILEAFGTNTQNDFDGDLAQLLSTRTPIYGAIAWVNVLCQPYEPNSQSGRYAFSEIENTFNNVPNFSWTVEVIAHETGHNYGSMHTQACVWPVFQGGGIGAIDSCVNAENGTCFTQTRPNPNGTIMSYCHIPVGGGINFNLGFGPLPGDTLRLGYEVALCLDSALNSSEQPLAFKLLQNYPNPFNPGTNIKFALPEDGFVTLRLYDLLGQEIATLIDSRHYEIGIFSYNLDASSYNLASGVYFYKLDVSKNNNSVYSQIKKMVLVK